MEEAFIQWVNAENKGGDHLFKQGDAFQYGVMTLVHERPNLFLYVGMEKSLLTIEDIRNIAGEVNKFLRGRGVIQASFLAEDLSRVCPEWSMSVLFSAFYEGWFLSQYQFNKYKSKKTNTSIQLTIEGEPTEEYKRLALHRSEAVNAARDLCNEPPNALNPDTYDSHVKALFNDTSVNVTIYEKEDLKDLQLNGILAVARGSAHAPKFIQLSYRTLETAPHIALVGKGVTFDTGGINAKTGDFTDMKMDMGGSAAVIGAMKLLSNVKAKVNVTALIPVVDNVPDASALLPSEIIQYKNGVSVQVANTDAEGRLILADALLFAQELGAEIILDIATLTGSIGHALGLKVAGVMSDDEALSERLKRIGTENGDLIWPLPLIKEYDEELNNPYADIANVGKSPYGGAIMAAVFLNRFIQRTTRWAHIDMANTVQAYKDFGYYPPGASGYGVRLLADFVLGESLI
ncbi:leucyl aminopeptidase [Pullulanibacillus pueri]|uniref:Probable cytosol aminopeptidase n=1 Tax=Pullulanibacillus pueri TaxID=1437324 RepID=A0A8J3ELA3_9BACL|nr:leucyl aminopeptidase family protein [Pullulanibacillus pueri]MBM7682044.1 leucyl aminopeptidase [Pullulanibacillus pueri]GGH80193.1 hypothetical protein GCM10007096_16240 [Pullulanibacillus pueri]